MKVFHFGSIRPHRAGKGTVGEFALHVQCPWRIIDGDGIVTGSGDYYRPPEGAEDPTEDDFEKGNLQRCRLLTMLGKYDPDTRSVVNETDALTVTAVRADCFGGLKIEIAGGVALEVFPSGSSGEQWRFLSTISDEDHLVIGNLA